MVEGLFDTLEKRISTPMKLSNPYYVARKYKK